MEKNFSSKRIAEVDYIESEVDKILYDLRDCLIGKTKRPDFLYLISTEHCISYGETLLRGELSNYGIDVRVCTKDDIPKLNNICVYDLDEQRWLKIPNQSFN